jgi:hypothetical protein
VIQSQSFFADLLLQDATTHIIATFCGLTPFTIAIFLSSPIALCSQFS